MGAGQLSNVGEPKYREPEVVKIGNNTPPKTPPGMIVSPIPPNTTWLDLRNREYAEFAITVDHDFNITLVNANEGARLKLFIHRTQDTRISVILNPWENRVSIPGKSETVFILDVECIKKPDQTYLYPQIVNPIDDEVESDYKTFSSKKILEKAVQAAGSLINDTVEALDSVWSSSFIQTKITAIYSAIDGIINDSLSTGTKRTYSISKIKSILTGYLPVSAGKTISVNSIKADTGNLKIELNGSLYSSQTICIENSDGNRTAIILEYDSGTGKWQIGGTIDATNLQKRGKDLATQEIVDALEEAFNLQFISERELSETNYPRKNAVTNFAEDVYFAKSIFQQGDSYETHAEQVITKNDFIIMRDGAIGGLGSSLSGFKILKANGVVNLIMGAGSDAIARVGWEGEQLQAIATREDNPLNNGLSFWNDVQKRFDTTNYSYTELLRNSESAVVTGLWSFSQGNLILNNGRDWRFLYTNDYFIIRNNTSTWNALSITKDNFVGIGNNSPSERLQVNGNIRADGRLVVNGATYSGDNSHIICNQYNNKSLPLFMVRENSDGKVWMRMYHGTTENISLRTNANSFILNNNFGLGIDAPSEKLHVVGNALITGTINGVNTADLARKSLDQLVSGIWTFRAGDIHLVNITSDIDSTTKERISGIKLGRQSVQNTHHWELYARSNRTWGERPDFHIEMSGDFDTIRHRAVKISGQGGSFGWIGFGLPEGATPSERLHVVGNAKIDGNVYVVGTLTQNSDKRLKSNIKPLTPRGTLNPVSYTINGKKQIGFIAQEVREHYPELVAGKETENEFLSLNYAQLTAVLYAEINDLKRQVKLLTEQIAQR